MKPEDSDKNFIFKKKNCQILVRKKIHYYHYYINYCSSSFEVSFFPNIASPSWPIVCQSSMASQISAAVNFSTRYKKNYWLICALFFIYLNPGDKIGENKIFHFTLEWLVVSYQILTINRLSARVFFSEKVSFSIPWKCWILFMN